MAAWLLFVGGCGRQTGWVLKPVPIDEELRETIVAEDEGWFVFDKVAIVDVDGLILNERRRGTFGTEDNPVSLFLEKLDKAAEDEDVKAIVLRINSPGGTVTATDIMYRRLCRFRRQTNKLVVAVIEDIGASGGYYLACGADAIVAHSTSVVGSIGVIMQTVSLSGTLKMLGIEAKAVTSGPYKDLASALKPLDEKDLTLLQKMVDIYHEGFVEVVKAGRKRLSKERVKQLADGRVFTGRQAKDCGLVDSLGGTDAAVVFAKKLSDTKQVQVVIYHRPIGYRANVYSTAQVPAQVSLINVTLPDLLNVMRPRFLYLWTGRMLRSE